MLIATSGTTGLPKLAEITHRNLIQGFTYLWSFFDNFPNPTRLPLIMSPVQWFSAIFVMTSSPLFRQTRLQTSLTFTQEHAYELINKYKPTFATSSSSMWVTLFKPEQHEKCNFSSLEVILIGGSAMHPTLLQYMKNIIPNTTIANMYGMSECSGPAFLPDLYLVNPETLAEITEPNKPGELWIKGPSIFKCYRNNPKVTKDALTDDGWLRSGDIMYRDEKWYFYFVERLKSLPPK
ncbi:unnamed protein product [Leptidea sinapis]|uniref:AMP-dependent synthetase/ligase domain-containing protein n=1 Tax=Leptidea sinapis TaxID=189913 RepID=A0A5E4QGD7_9NEOP|nr:unnamed protein product [Leptidea sinapis]